MENPKINSHIFTHQGLVENPNDYWWDSEQSYPCSQQTIIPYSALQQVEQYAGAFVTPNDNIDFADIVALKLIAVIFNPFTDGRGFSLAKLLRQQGYNGNLRASGIIADQMVYAKRCGFDQFELAQDGSLTDTFSDLPASYNH